MGQNWLRGGRMIKIMIETARLSSGDTVLEVGPGTGTLTEALLTSGARVVAVEKDDRLIGRLAEKFAAAIKNKQLELIHADILKFEGSKLKAKSWKLIANPPYYLTGRLLRRFLSSAHQPILAVLMLQKEVAERIVAKDACLPARQGKESLLSISVKCYGTPSYIQTVPARSFRPRPKVDSAIVLIDQISKNNFRELGEEKFFTRLKQGFAGKRKMLRPKLGLTPEKMIACGIAPTARAEDLTMNQWLCLTRYCS
ncbi:MAG: ribosomal RNA small subunit methyltransferase A [Candidatus Vogelbacteria bacterium]|nr:ribosomal RNA small subunit methyltransferase A [Candidatus Vogelbacteria bacterium]